MPKANLVGGAKLAVHVLSDGTIIGSMDVQASSVRAPALLECVAAMAASPSLAPVLAGRPSVALSSDTKNADASNTMSPDSLALGHK